MSQTPPPLFEPLPVMPQGEPAAPGRRRWAVSEMAAWAAIVVAVAVVVISVFLARANAAADGDRTEVRVQQLLSSRYALGMKALTQGLGRAGAGGAMAGTDQQAMKQLVDGVEQQAKAPPEKFRAAILRGEMEGPETGIARAEDLGAESAALGEDVDTLRQLYAHEQVEPARWTAFRERHGWFADLAAVQGKPESDPARAAVVNAGVRTMAAMITIVLLALAAGLIGLVLLVIALVRLKSGKLHLAFDRDVPLPADRRAYVQAFAVFIGSYVAGGLLLRTAADFLPKDLSMILPMAAMFIAVLAGTLWPLFMGQRRGEWRAANGLHAGRGMAREIFCGIAGYFAGFPLLVLGALLTIVLVRTSGAETSHPIMRQLSGGWGAWVGIFLLATVWAPVTEELMFRGSLFAHLRERFGWWVSAPVVGLIFALIHPQGWAAVPALTAIAIVFAGIREWRGSVVGCMAAHALHNGVAVLVATMMFS